jgi:hypothetical protein
MRLEFKWFGSNGLPSPGMPPAPSALVAAFAQFVDVVPFGNADHVGAPREAAAAASNAESFATLT